VVRLICMMILRMQMMQRRQTMQKKAPG